MAELAKSIDGSMMISINDHPDIRELFGFMPVVEVDYQYTVGGSQNAAECVELIYGNFKDGKMPEPKFKQVSMF